MRKEFLQSISDEMNNIKVEINKSEEQINSAKELVAKATKKRDDHIKELRTLDSMISTLSRRDPEPTPMAQEIDDEENN
jgi:chromosome segregation ATPase|tara:strand:- start:655 stop:891 length:237 start_codon:yes stop_codon:yes gene_type:complete